MAHVSHAERPSHFGTADWREVGKRVKGEVSRDNLSIVSAGVAFYAIFALFPALAALVSIYGLVANPSDVQQMMQSIQGFLPKEAAGIISGQLNKLVANSGSALGVGAAVGILVALWSATKGTKSMMTAMNIAYGEEEDRGFLRFNAVALLMTLGLIVGAVIAIAFVIAAPALLGNLGLPDIVSTLLNWLRWPLLAVVMLFGVAVLYRYGPSRRPAQWRWASYGAGAATLLWLIASGLFSWYVSNFGSYNETYGSMGAIIILLMWFYISAFVVLLGAEINSEMERQTEPDTTTGEPKPRGARGAAAADEVADEDRFKA